MQSKKFDWILYYSDLWLKEDAAKKRKRKHEQRESDRETKA